MDGEGFEPSKALPTDLQSAPFGHSGTPPYGIVEEFPSGQMGQTVNLLRFASVVRIHHRSFKIEYNIMPMWLNWQSS